VTSVAIGGGTGMTAIGRRVALGATEGVGDTGTSVGKAVDGGTLFPSSVPPATREHKPSNIKTITEPPGCFIAISPFGAGLLGGEMGKPFALQAYADSRSVVETVVRATIPADLALGSQATVLPSSRAGPFGAVEPHWPLAAGPI